MLAKQSWAYNGVTGVNNAAGDFGVGLPTAAGTIALQNGTTLDSQSYSRDRGQNKRVMSDSAPGLTALTRTNTYDSLSRLTATAGTAYGAGAQVALDGANNRVSVTGGMACDHPSVVLRASVVQASHFTTEDAVDTEASPRSPCALSLAGPPTSAAPVRPALPPFFSGSHGRLLYRFVESRRLTRHHTITEG